MNTWLLSMKLHVLGCGFVTVVLILSSCLKVLPNSINFLCVAITYRCALIFLILKVFNASGRGCVAYQFDDVNWVCVSDKASFTAGFRTFRSFKSISVSISASSGLTTNDPSIMTAGEGVTIHTDGGASCVIGANGGGDEDMIMRHGVDWVVVSVWNVGSVITTGSSCCLRFLRRGCGLLLALDDSLGWMSVTCWIWGGGASTIFTTGWTATIWGGGGGGAASIWMESLELSEGVDLRCTWRLRFGSATLIFSTPPLIFSTYFSGIFSILTTGSCRKSMWRFKAAALRTIRQWRHETMAKGSLSGQ